MPSFRQEEGNIWVLNSSWLEKAAVPCSGPSPPCFFRCCCAIPAFLRLQSGTREGQGRTSSPLAGAWTQTIQNTASPYHVVGKARLSLGLPFLYLPYSKYCPKRSVNSSMLLWRLKSTQYHTWPHQASKILQSLALKLRKQPRHTNAKQEYT